MIFIHTFLTNIGTLFARCKFDFISEMQDTFEIKATKFYDDFYWRSLTTLICGVANNKIVRNIELLFESKLYFEAGKVVIPLITFTKDVDCERFKM